MKFKISLAWSLHAKIGIELIHHSQDKDSIKEGFKSSVIRRGAVAIIFLRHDLPLRGSWIYVELEVREHPVYVLKKCP